MDKPPNLTDDQLETRRALIKLLIYVEDECARSGYSATSWLVGISRATLENELTAQPLLHLDDFGQPRFN